MAEITVIDVVAAAHLHGLDLVRMQLDRVLEAGRDQQVVEWVAPVELERGVDDLAGGAGTERKRWWHVGVGYGDRTGGERKMSAQAGVDQRLVSFRAERRRRAGARRNRRADEESPSLS